MSTTSYTHIVMLCWTQHVTHMGNFIGMGTQKERKTYMNIKSMPFKVTMVWRISQSRKNGPKAKSRWKGNKEILERILAAHLSLDQGTFISFMWTTHLPRGCHNLWETLGLVIAPLTLLCGLKSSFAPSSTRANCDGLSFDSQSTNASRHVYSRLKLNPRS